MADSTPEEKLAIRRQQNKKAVRLYRLRHPDRALIMRLRDARRLLRQHNFTVGNDGDCDLDDLRSLERSQPATSTDEGGDPRDTE